MNRFCLFGTSFTMVILLAMVMPVPLALSDANQTKSYNGPFEFYSSQINDITEENSPGIGDVLWKGLESSKDVLMPISLQEESATVTVTTEPVTSISSHSATSGGEVIADDVVEITSRGVCWSKSANPTINDHCTNDGTGTGVFVSSLEGLTSETTYHVRAYATSGEIIHYGNEQVFVTSRIVWSCVSSATELQEALRRAETNKADDIICIVRGSYFGNFGYQPTDGDNQSNSLILEGGFSRGCGSRVIDPTNTILDAGGNGRVLRFISQGKAHLFVRGLTLQNGRVASGFGGGLFARTTSHVILRNNIFSKNTAIQGGGGAYIATRAILINNTFTENLGAYGGHRGPGGGVYVGSGSNMADNIFEKNTAANGGGAYAGSDSTITNNSFVENTATFAGKDTYETGQGGGLYVGSNSIVDKNNFLKNVAVASWNGGEGGGSYVENPSILSDNVFMGNVSEFGGGASGGGTLINNTFNENVALSGGGGVSWRGTLMNNTFNQNRARNGGGVSGSGIFVNNIFYQNVVNMGGGAYIGGNSILTNNTFYENAAEERGGGLHLSGAYIPEGGMIQVFNNIVWKNTAPQGSDIYIENSVHSSGGIGLFNNNFDQSISGTHMVVPFAIDPSNLNNKDPLFVGNGNFNLTALSPCINAGENNAPDLPETDKDGNPRVVAGIVDIGAYEAPLKPGPYIYVNSDGICGGNSPCVTSVQAALDMASNGTIIKVTQGIYDEYLVLNELKTIMLQGGWDNNFENQTAKKTSVKSPSVPQGTLIFEMFTIAP